MPVGGSLPFAPNHALQGGGGPGGSGSGALGLGALPLNVDSAAESRRALAESARLLHTLNRQQAANANRSSNGSNGANGKTNKRRPQSAPAARRQMSGAERLIQATEARKRQRRRGGGR